MTNTVYVIIAASVGTASVVGLTVAAVVVVCRARKGGRRGIDHYDFSEDTQVLCFPFLFGTPEQFYEMWLYYRRIPY